MEKVPIYSPSVKAQTHILYRALEYHEFASLSVCPLCHWWGICLITMFLHVWTEWSWHDLRPRQKEKEKIKALWSWGFPLNKSKDNTNFLEKELGFTVLNKQDYSNFFGTPLFLRISMRKKGQLSKQFSFFFFFLKHLSKAMFSHELKKAN